MKISQILKETTIPQITNRLIKFRDDTNEVIGKSALGVLACESDDPSVHLSRERLYVSHYQIVESYGIKDEKVYPYLAGNNFFWDYNSELSLIIKTLNDSCNFTFKEIGEFLDITFDL
ncbi:MAG: hypothetical protein IIA82_02460 [Thaumarchaeota archaeon]|nr:hypothetical protein [Nitrososphaerota archaeon]